MDVSFRSSSQHSNWSVSRVVYVDESPMRFMFESPFTTLIILGKEYAAADLRWGLADPNLVSLEILTVLGVGPLCCYVLKQIANDDPARYYWLIVLSTAELYGGFVPWNSMKTHYLSLNLAG